MYYLQRAFGIREPLVFAILSSISAKTCGALSLCGDAQTWIVGHVLDIDNRLDDLTSYVAGRKPVRAMSRDVFSCTARSCSKDCELSKLCHYRSRYSFHPLPDASVSPSYCRAIPLLPCSMTLGASCPYLGSNPLYIRVARNSPPADERAVERALS